MRASLRIGWLCAVLVAAGCAVDSDPGDSPKTGVPTSAAAESAPVTATTAPSSTTTSEVEPPPTSASVPRAEAPDDPSPGETPAADPAEQPTSSGDEAPPDENIGTVPDALPDDEPSPEPEPETLLTWQGIPVIDLSGTVPAAADGTVTAPRLLTRFDDVEVLLHNQDHAWTFNPDGSIDKEWAFDVPVRTVFPDGAGGILYQDGAGFDDLVNNSSIHHLNEPGHGSKALVDCTGDCVGLWLAGVVYLGSSTEVVYTVESWPPLPDDAEYPYPTQTEVLHRFDLRTQESVELAPVGGWEWWFYNTVVVGNELFGAWGTDGGNGVVGYDLLDGSSIFGGFETAEADCFDTGPSLDCPRFAFASTDHIVTAFWDYRSTFIVSSYNRDPEEHRYTLPIAMPAEVNDIYGIEVWDSVLIINTLVPEEATDSSQRRWMPYRAVLIDLETHETELYSHAGVLRVVARTAAG